MFRCIFFKHNLALSLEKKVFEPVRPNSVGGDRGKYAVRMDGIFVFKNCKVVELDFTCGSATAPSYMKKSLLGKLPELLEKEKRSAYADRVLQNPLAPDRGKVDFISLACVYPTNQWGKSFEDFIKEVKKQVNPGKDGDDSAQEGQVDRARMQNSLASHYHQSQTPCSVILLIIRLRDLTYLLLIIRLISSLNYFSSIPGTDS